ncbi:sugar transferase [Pseudophaeobacter sp.]|uniref:sugar transferase n=1 Tax=Pseudophaeobacter sp. TaxID=1971739 RepID=UPI00329790F3
MKDYVEFFDTNYLLEIHAAAPSEIRTGIYQKFGKRTLDVVLALLLVPVLAPIVALLWVLVRRDGGSGFFGHTRIGRNNKPFRCWKVRTMVHGAEEKLKTYLAENPEAAEEWARDHKLTNDPRITPLGNFLRKTSLDELPQLWNVLKGEMSFVGPRPIVTAELEKYGTAAETYLALKPGITGLWQVSGRNDVSYNERVAMDMDYAKRMAFGLDLELILRTGTSVVGTTGR